MTSTFALFRQKSRLKYFPEATKKKKPGTLKSQADDVSPSSAKMLRDVKKKHAAKYAPSLQCHVEDEMLECLSDYPEADAKELSVFFFSLFPDGIPEEYQDWDNDDEDDDDE